VAEQEVRVYLPEVRPARYSGASPGWFRWSVGGALAVTLGALSVGQDWPRDVVALALEVTGRDEPVINDIVTLSWDGGVDTRTWDGVKWIPLRDFVDGNLFVEGSIQGGAWAANQAVGRLIKFGSLTNEETAANAVGGQHAVLRTVTSREVSDVEQFITNSIQIGPGRITVLNLDDSISPFVSSRARGLPLRAGTTWRRVGSLSAASFIRGDVRQTITLSAEFNVDITTAANPGAFVEVTPYLRARIGTSPTSYSASTIYSQYTWTGTTRRVASTSVSTSIYTLRSRSVFCRYDDSYLYRGRGRGCWVSDERGNSAGLTWIPVNQSRTVYRSVFSHNLHSGIEESFSGDILTMPSEPITISLAHSPLNANRYIFLDGYYVLRQSNGTRDDRGSNRNEYFPGRRNSISVAVNFQRTGGGTIS